ncbi:hypothetical protein [Rheinheimera sp.]|uniref:hypothetical protein n=1 Tax=Rheinheimera sp. TaxID=1869214 RepID=UPI00307D5D1E
MKQVVVSLVATSLMQLPASYANDDFSVSGFGSIVGGSVLQGDGYWARLPEAARQYKNDVDFQTESRLGIQGRYKATSSLSITGQLMTRGVNDFQPDLEWFYASYQLTPDSRLQLGRMRLPVYHYSDAMDIGIAYPWLRVPSDAYSLAITNFHGASLQHRMNWQLGTTAFKLYAGQQNTDPNKLLTTIEQYKTEQLYDDQGHFTGVRNIRSSKEYKQLKGLVVDTNIDWFNLRLSYLDGKENYRLYADEESRSEPLYGGQWTDSRFIDVSLSVDYSAFYFITEWNNYHTIYSSWFSSLAYRMGPWTPYLFYSSFKGTQTSIGNPVNLDDHYSSVGVGTRYNLSSKAAIKLELTDFSDKGDAAVFIDKDQDGDTDATAIAVALDFSF